MKWQYTDMFAAFCRANHQACPLRAIPIYYRDWATLGIANLMHPDYGETVEIYPGEVPVFWARGVASQVLAGAARLAFFVTLATGKMLVTDRLG